MSGSKYCAVLLAAALLAGCVSAVEQPAQSRAVVEPAREIAETAESAPIIPNEVIDLNSRVDNAASVVTCRDLLKQGSNVIVTTCMTRADWEKFERRQAIEAREIVRTLQGGAYR